MDTADPRFDEVSQVTTRSSTQVDDHERPSTDGWSNRLERASGPALLLAGGSMLASAVAPPALAPFVDAAWAPGVALAGLGVLALAAGLVGLARQVGEDSQLATAGTAFAGLAGLAAASMLALLGAGGVATVAGASVPEPKPAFVLIAGTMAGGTSLGLLALGVGSARTGGASRRVARLLIAGGLLFAVPLAVGLARLVGGLDVPPWPVFPALLGGAVVVLALGAVVRSSDGT